MERDFSYPSEPNPFWAWNTAGFYRIVRECMLSPFLRANQWTKALLYARKCKKAVAFNFHSSFAQTKLLLNWVSVFLDLILEITFFFLPNLLLFERVCLCICVFFVDGSNVETLNDVRFRSETMGRWAADCMSNGCTVAKKYVNVLCDISTQEIKTVPWKRSALLFIWTYPEMWHYHSSKTTTEKFLCSFLVL